MPVQKTCVVCGQGFSVPPCRAKTATTCSNKCAIIVRAKSRERKVTCICKNCGIEFQVPRCHEGRRIYCSVECKTTDAEYRKNMSSMSSGENNARWKSGEHLRKDGYLYKHCLKHPFSHNNYVLKHRLTMESSLIENNSNSIYLVTIYGKKYLDRSFHVHHLDWDRSNNEIENLIVCTPSVHGMIHQGVMPSPENYWPHDAKIKVGRTVKEA